MVDLIQELITDTVVGASIGSVITLFGVWITNRFQQKSIEKDREFKLKSELYMSAVEEINQLKILLCKLHNVSQKEMDSIKGVAIAKLAVIATNETFQAITEFYAAIGVKILHLMPEKISLDNLRSDIQIISSQFERTIKKQDQTLNTMSTYNKNDPAFWKKLQGDLDHYLSQMDKMVKDNDKKNAQLKKGIKELYIKGVEATISLTELEVRAISCVRKELNMPFDEDEYRNIVQNENEKMEAEISKVLVRISNFS